MLAFNAAIQYMHVCVRYQISIHEKQTKNSIPYALQPWTLLKTKLIKCVNTQQNTENNNM